MKRFLQVGSVSGRIGKGSAEQTFGLWDGRQGFRVCSWARRSHGDQSGCFQMQKKEQGTENIQSLEDRDDFLSQRWQKGR